MSVTYLNAIHDWRLLAPPGSGKTTMQEMLLLHMVNTDQSNRIPFLVRFDNSADDVVEFMQLRWSLGADLLQLGRMGKVIFFFDGLNTLSPTSKSQFDAWLASDQAPQRYVIAALTADNLNIPQVQIAPLSKDEIEAFIKGLLPTTPAVRLISRIKNSEIYPLADHPAMLQALVNIEWSDAIGELFDRFMMRLMSDERQRQDMPDLDLNTLWVAIARLAFSLLEGDEIDVEKACIVLGGESMLAFCQRANILRIADNKVTFTFYQLRDYFSAVWLERSGGLLWLQSNIEWNQKYELVMRCWVGITSTPDALLDLLADQHPELALASITPTIRAQQPTVNKVVLNALARGEKWVYHFPAPVVSGLVHALRAPEWEVRSRACQILLDADLEPSPAIVSTLTDLRSDLQEPAAYGIMQLREAAFPSLIALLRHHDVQLRQNATWGLSQLRDRAAIPPLVTAISDTDEGVGLQALHALGQRSDNEAIPGVIDALPGLTENVYEAAKQYLLTRHSAALGSLIAASKQNATAVRVTAIDVLAAINVPESSSVLIDLTQDDDFAIQEAALHGLATHEGDDVLACIGAFITEDKKVSADMQRLSQIAKEILSPRTSPAAKDESNVMRVADEEPSPPPLPHRVPQTSAETAVKRLKTVVGDHTDAGTTQPLSTDAARLALVHAQREATVDVALEVLAHALTETLSVRLAAVEVLSEMEDKRALTVLRKCLINDMEPVREAAAAVLALLPATDILEDAQDTATTEVGKVIQDVLEHEPAETTTDVDKPPTPSVDFLSRLIEDIRHLDWGRSEESAKALKAYIINLHEDNKLKVIDKLATLVDDDNMVLKWSAIEGLGWIKDARAAQAVLPALQDKNWTIRTAALRSLAEIGDRSAVQACLACLSDPKTAVREAAIETLGLLEDRQSVPSLLQIVNDEDPLLRLAAIVALHRIGAPTIDQILIKAAIDTNKNIRWTAAYALGERPNEAATGALIRLLKDTEQPYWEEDRICDLAAAALHKINTPDAIKALKNWQRPADV